MADNDDGELEEKLDRSQRRQKALSDLSEAVRALRDARDGHFAGDELVRRIKRLARIMIEPEINGSDWERALPELKKTARYLAIHHPEIMMNALRDIYSELDFIHPVRQIYNDAFKEFERRHPESAKSWVEGELRPLAIKDINTTEAFSKWAHSIISEVPPKNAIVRLKSEAASQPDFKDALDYFLLRINKDLDAFGVLSRLTNLSKERLDGARQLQKWIEIREKEWRKREWAAAKGVLGREALLLAAYGPQKYARRLAGTRIQPEKSDPG